jgi:hypothetical protein
MKSIAKRVESSSGVDFFEFRIVFRQVAGERVSAFAAEAAVLGMLVYS